MNNKNNDKKNGTPHLQSPKNQNRRAALGRPAKNYWGGGGTSFIFSEILWPILLLIDPRPFISNRNYARTINGSCGKFSNVIVCSPSPVLRDSNTDSENVDTTFCIRRGQKTCNLRYIPVLTDHTEE